MDGVPRQEPLHARLFDFLIVTGLVADTPIEPLATDPVWDLPSTMTEIAAWPDAGALRVG